MKSNVTVEELNAAIILLTGISVSQLVEVHITGSAVTAISVEGEGNLKAHRIPIGNPAPPVEEPEVTEVEDAAESVEWFEPMVEDTVDAEETDEDDGT